MTNFCPLRGRSLRDQRAPPSLEFHSIHSWLVFLRKTGGFAPSPSSKAHPQRGDCNPPAPPLRFAHLFVFSLMLFIRSSPPPTLRLRLRGRRCCELIQPAKRRHGEMADSLRRFASLHRLRCHLFAFHLPPFSRRLLGYGGSLRDLLRRSLRSPFLVHFIRSLGSPLRGLPRSLIPFTFPAPRSYYPPSSGSPFGGSLLGRRSDGSRFAPFPFHVFRLAASRFCKQNLRGRGLRPLVVNFAYLAKQDCKINKIWLRQINLS